MNEQHSKLKNLFRKISQARLTQQGLAENVLIKEIIDGPRVLSHWMAIILISGRNGKIVFKTHFKTRNAQLLAAPLYSLPPERVSAEQAIDCMREFCNLTAGAIKQALTPYLDLHLSLPMITRGFDEVFWQGQVSSDQFSDRWRLAYRDNEVNCSATVDFSEPGDLVNFEDNFDPNSETVGEIEFL